MILASQTFASPFEGQDLPLEHLLAPSPVKTLNV
jgi:hypothetical protein